MNIKTLFWVIYFVMMFGFIVIGVNTVVKHINKQYFNDDVKTLTVQHNMVGILIDKHDNRKLIHEGDTYLSTDSVDFTHVGICNPIPKPKN